MKTSESTTNYASEMENHQRAIIEAILMEARYNRTKAAKIMGVNRKTLYNKMKSLGLQPIKTTTISVAIEKPVVEQSEPKFEITKSQLEFLLNLKSKLSN